VTALRLFAIGLGYIAAGLAIALLITALAVPAMLYVVWSNWSGWPR
jgi:hypothetical protein